ncbi:hypothetical protein PTTG_11653 [Puccinia triticina 1-1 BBBD Race 1]|uniref:Uncharacterized protein n=2 Tax=Puccinia triticina TaxID=208348 RepID=A0A180GWX1_PUCT1|nr:uncharacterized protein PtA15_6A243 [Puccinia triticina]OAV97024.1 hypothetical protein PTTG_11653 [Puccinia triticina 1-1 BBBD Race 1]WAQ85615.1 hypothetical protein PtA15_6A243 [Puccinia triticina]WAR55494.1 hypothetical protein PtB15_6B235 [Puccinia triticina]
MPGSMVRIRCGSFSWVDFQSEHLFIYSQRRIPVPIAFHRLDIVSLVSHSDQEQKMVKAPRKYDDQLENTFLLLVERLETFYSNEKRFTRFSITGHFNHAMDYHLLITPKAFFKPRKIEIHDQLFKENFFDSESNGNRMVTSRKNKEWTFKISEDQSYTFYQKITARSGYIVCDSNGKAVAKLNAKKKPLSGHDYYQIEIDQRHPIMNILTVVGLLLTIKEENELQRAAGGINTFTLGAVGINTFNVGQI